jgi:hypothetical protein
LITLITNVHPARRGYLLAARSRAGRLKHRHCQRKTSLLQDRSDGERSGSTDMGCAPAALITLEGRSLLPMIRTCDWRSDRSPLHDVRQHASTGANARWMRNLFLADEQVPLSSLEAR